MASKKLDQIRGGKSNILDAVLDELNAEGFPDFMVNAFLQTAETTNTIVSSRLPGGAGVDLMEANYDLKGFQIKAKSCDWGPMAGFICQLPFLNKAGYEKINYNTGYIIDYLKSLSAYNDSDEAKNIKKTQQALDAVNKNFDENEAEFGGSLSSIFKTDKDKFEILVKMLGLKEIEDSHEISGFINSKEKAEIANLYTEAAIKIDFDKKIASQKEYEKLIKNQPKGVEKSISTAAYRTFIEIKGKINKVYNMHMADIVDKYRINENEKSTWSGENSIPITEIFPFIELKRKFGEKIKDVIAELEKNQCDKLEEVYGRVFGTAFNEATRAKSSILIDFMLEQVLNKDGKETALWAIYYKAIYYRRPGDIDPTLYDFSSLLRGPNCTEVVDTPVNRTALEKLNIVPKEGGDPEVFYPKVFKYIGRILTNNSLSVDVETETNSSVKTTYYPVCGFMNPHPPYKLGDDSFYKNAVSGDFDLFAFWPRRTLADVTVEQLRMSEIRLIQDLKLYLNLDQTVGIEFIPGVTELTRGGLKEDAETGNISSLGGLVSGMLNSLADANYINIYGDKKNAVAKNNRRGILATNRAFHSDEGGRPGVMEIEFPIAIFFPESVVTKALNNAGANCTAIKVNDRTPIKTRGGLIKNVEEFLQLIVDVNFSPELNKKHSYYKIMLHSAWMIHLFYASLLKDATGQVGSPREHVKFLNAGGLAFVDKPEKKLDEFKDITEHHVAELKEAGREFDTDTYVNNLKIILRAEQDSTRNFLPLRDDKFKAMRTVFLKLAFEGNDDNALVRKNKVRGSGLFPQAAPIQNP